MRLRVGVLTAAVALVCTGLSAAGSEDPTAVEPGGEIATLAELEGPVMVELTGAPSAVVYASARKQGASEAQAGDAAEDRAAANKQAQDRVLQAIEAQDIDATPIFDVQTAYNGVALNVEPGAAAELASLPGVKAVHQIPVVSLDNHSSVPLIGAPQAWGAFGLTGAGKTIAVIDTGVDWVHRGFAGSGLATDYTIARSALANPPATSDDPAGFTVTGAGGTQIYPSAKVVGGFDFAGDDYSANSPGAGIPFDPVPKPDPNPLDCNGHGSHVAGTAAGTGVNADGTTYTGPYNASLDTAAMSIGPGVAPQAGIYALRIFGCNGDTVLTAAAINWATDPNRDGNPADHVDIINMSVGSAYGTPDDPTAAASNNAAAAGVQVVTSAGNNTDVYYVTSSPGTAVRALSTASSLDAAERADAIVVHAPAAIAGTHIASRSVAFNWAATPETTDTVYYPASNQFGCSVWSAEEKAKIAGRIVLIDWKVGNDPFPCGSVARGANAVDAGATGIIMADSTTFLDTAITGSAVIPAMYTNATVGNALKSQLTAGVVTDNVNVTLSSLVVGESVDPARVDALSGFSSRGPRGRDTGLKPDIAAPGQTVWSVDRLTGNKGRSLNGTSMASPHMAGVMALLHQKHPTWTVEERKALAMNTAAHDIFTGFNKTGDKFGVGRVGAGRVDVPGALASSSIALNNDGSGAVSVSFGALEVLGSLTATRTIRVVNRGASAQTYSIGYDARASIPGVSYSFPDGTSLSVPAGGTGTFRVQLNANAAAMQNTRDATVAAVQAGNPRHWLPEAAGHVLVTPAGGSALRVPVYATARPASATAADSPFLKVTGGTGTIALEGAGVNSGGPEPLGYLSKVSAFELQHTSGLATLGAGVSPLARNGDLQYVGAATKTIPATPPATPTPFIYFGVTTHGDWSPAATDNQLTIQVDRTAPADGTPDWQAFNFRFTDTDVFVVARQNLPAGGLAATTFVNTFSSNTNTAPYNNNVMVLPVPISTLGLAAGQTSFKYRVIGASRFWGTIETTPWLTYDVAAPGLAFADGLGSSTMYPDVAGTSIGVTFNAANFGANGSQGVLLLHHFGQAAQRTEVLPVATTTFGLLALKGGACDNQAFELSGNSNQVVGNVHSNGGLKISGSKNTVSGALTYRTGCRADVKGLTATATGLQADPLAHLTPAHFPCTFSRSGSWDLKGPLAPGVYCATGTIKLSASKVSGDVTLVANRVEISGSDVNLTPNRLGVVAWASGTGDAIKVSGSKSTFAGIAYAPNGKAEFSGSNSTLGSVVASTIKLSGNDSTAQG
jgi:subtilisin family serine protease